MLVLQYLDSDVPLFSSKDSELALKFSFDEPIMDVWCLYQLVILNYAMKMLQQLN